MVTITPEMAGNLLVAMGISYVVVIVFSLYSLWLNYKQSKVKNQMEVLIDEVKTIRKFLHETLQK